MRAQRLSEVLDTAVEVTHLEAEDRSSGDAEKKVDDVARGRSRQVLQVIQDQIKKQVSSQVVFNKSLVSLYLISSHFICGFHIAAGPW